MEVKSEDEMKSIFLHYLTEQLKRASHDFSYLSVKSKIDDETEAYLKKVDEMIDGEFPWAGPEAIEVSISRDQVTFEGSIGADEIPDPEVLEPELDYDPETRHSRQVGGGPPDMDAYCRSLEKEIKKHFQEGIESYKLGKVIKAEAEVKFEAPDPFVGDWGGKWGTFKFVVKRNRR